MYSVIINIYAFGYTSTRSSLAKLPRLPLAVSTESFSLFFRDKDFAQIHFTPIFGLFFHFSDRREENKM